ncbi:MAG: hypothetical protein HDQ99_04250 [Lachnospiraceae bacterium]|nr:hypothetical protein [Lachnospiraceae bacterium]
MAPTKIPHLCGGILFGLLYESKKPRRKAKDKLKGGSDGLTIPGIYAGLINVVTGEDLSAYAGTTLKKCATNYRKCEDSTGGYVPFTEPATQSAFDSQYKRKDPDLLKRMSGFIDTYLNKTKCEWLVRALIETIQQEQLDIEIAINYTDSLKSGDLHKADSILFLPFLLSVLHYVVMNCPDCESGRPTFETWYSQSSSRAEWKFNSTIGDNISPMNVSVDLTLPVKCSNVIAQAEDDVITSPVSSEDDGKDKRSDHEAITESMMRSLQPLIKMLEAQKAQLPDADQMAKPLLALAAAAKVQEHKMAEKIRSDEKKNQQPTASEDLYYMFKTESDRILQYCIEKDPTAEPITIYLPDQMDSLIRKWNFEIRKIQDPDKQMLIQDVLQTMSDYLYYISDRYLKAANGEWLIFRNSSIEEGNRLCNELRPKSYELRCKLRDLYLKLWPAPALDRTPAEDTTAETDNADTEPQKDAKGAIVHQTVVNQYGDHPVHIDHVENLKL